MAKEFLSALEAEIGQQDMGKSPKELGLKREPEGAVTPGIRARVIGKK